MGKLLTPQTFRTGFTSLDMKGITSYLEYTGQTDFLKSIQSAKEKGLADGEILCSMYAKLCYKALVNDGRNKNITRVRDIPANIENCFNQGHGSVFENASVNFISTDVSRVLTHELVRMRAGWAYSQTSGRFCSLDQIDLVHDPLMDDCRDLEEEHLRNTEHIAYLMQCRKKLRKPPLDSVKTPAEAAYWPDAKLIQLRNSLDMEHEMRADEFRNWVTWKFDEEVKDRDSTKKITSAIRRIAPNGQTNEIGYSINFRALRHFIMMRSARHAEWEIRLVANQVYSLLKEEFPLLFFRAKTRTVDDLLEIYGLKMQPYELDSRDPEYVKEVPTEVLRAELATRA